MCNARFREELSMYYLPQRPNSIRVAFVNELILKCKLISDFVDELFYHKEKYDLVGQDLEQVVSIIANDAFDISDVKGPQNNDRFCPHDF